MPKRRRRSRSHGGAQAPGPAHQNGANGVVNGEEPEQPAAAVNGVKAEADEGDAAPYIVEFPDEDDNPNKAKKVKKEDEADKENHLNVNEKDGNNTSDNEDWSVVSLQQRIENALAGGTFYDDTSDEEGGEADANADPDTEIEVSVDGSEEDVSDDADNEGEDGDDDDDLFEDGGFEFDEENMFDSDSDAERLFDELDGMGLEMEGASNQELNSDEEIENVIASIRPKDEDHHLLSESERSRSESEADGSEEEDVVGPVDDLEELASADEADLYEDGGDEMEDDSFIVNEGDIIAMESLESTEDEGDEDEDEDGSEEDSDDDDDIDLEDDELDQSVSEQFRAHDKFDCHIEGYRTLKDNGLLLELDRTSAPKSRSGAFRPFKFTEKKLGDVHSVEVAEDAFSWMVGPLEVHYFYKYVFQRGCYRVSRRDNNYFKGLFSGDALLKMVQNSHLRYGDNINVASYTKEGGRLTHNLEGRVYARQLKKFVEEGKSIQCINPQSFSDEIWYLCEVLQEITNSFVGANTYYTPAQSAGFAPHWDEVDAFILQVEGSKYWRVWAPDDGDAALPDESSRNFTEEEMISKNLVFEGTLEEGDTLYIPRGFYHSARTGVKHSLHVTVSLCHKVTFTHLMKSVAEDVWDNIRTTRMLGRRSLPAHYLEMSGVAPLDYCHDFKTEIMPIVDSLLEDIKSAYKTSIPSAIDRIAADFMKMALPPMLTEKERKGSIHGRESLTMLGDAEGELNKNMQIKFIRMHTQRLLYETESTPYLAHRMSNSRIMSENRDLNIVKLKPNLVDGLKKLFANYPEWTKIKELKRGMKIARLLYDSGLIMVRKP